MGGAGAGAGAGKVVVWLCKVVAISIAVAGCAGLAEAQPEAKFNCSAAENATCQGLIDYRNPNGTTLGDIKTLFNVKHLPDILGANNFPTNFTGGHRVGPNQVVKVPFPCKCANGTGLSNRVPLYKIKAEDTLDGIARTVFAGVVKYQQIQAANIKKIPDANKITAGDTIWIPLPCSCDQVGGSSVVHYAHLVEAGSTIEAIAQQYGTSQQILLSLNGIRNPKDLMADQLLDVPLRTCNSSVKSDSSDFPLLVPNASYVYTAHECVKCRCDSSNNFMLQCEPSQLKPINHWSVCPSMECSANVLIGNTTSTSADSCSRTICDYAGYNSSNISAVLSTQNNCAVAPSGSDDSGASRSTLHGWVWNNLLIVIHLLPFFAYLL